MAPLAVQLRSKPQLSRQVSTTRVERAASTRDTTYYIKPPVGCLSYTVHATGVNSLTRESLGVV